LGFSAAAGLSNNEYSARVERKQEREKTVGEDAHICVELTCFNASLVVGSLSSRLGHGF
jgi:hypothetical protein